MGQPKLQIATDNGTFAERNAALKTAAGEWAGGLKEVAKQQLVDVGGKAGAYVHEHPGRFILGACALGMMAGFLLARKSHQQ